MKQNCPECGTALVVETSSFTGQKMREYECPACHWEHTEDMGVATWKAMSDAYEEEEKEQEKKEKEKGLVKRLLGKRQ